MASVRDVLGFLGDATAAALWALLTLALIGNVLMAWGVFVVALLAFRLIDAINALGVRVASCQSQQRGV